MSAQIMQVIPPQGFEVVRDEIGAIIVLELTNQKNLPNSRLTEDFECEVERLTPASAKSTVKICVHLAGATYGSMTQKDAQGRTLYHIDIDTSGEATDDASGSFISAQKLHKVMGMIMYIFRSAQYRLLGFAPGLIGGTYVEQFDTLDPNRKEDTDFSCFARIQIAVRIQESTTPWQGVLIGGADSILKLDTTDKGYKIVFNT